MGVYEAEPEANLTPLNSTGTNQSVAAMAAPVEVVPTTLAQQYPTMVLVSLVMSLVHLVVN